MRESTIVGFVGGPGSGKSTLALELSGWMKRKRMNVEYVGEYAKDLTWDGSYFVLEDQLSVLGEQFHRLYRLYGQADWIVTDSPLPIQLYYARGSCAKIARPSFHEAVQRLIVEASAALPTIHFKVERGDRAYVAAGRNQTEEAACSIDVELDEIYRRYEIPLQGPVSSLEQVIELLGFKDD